MGMTEVHLGKIMEAHRIQLSGLRHIAMQQTRIIALLEAGSALKPMTTAAKTSPARFGVLRNFRSKTWSEFSKLAASNIAIWLWGTLMWLIGAGGFGVLHWFARSLGFSM